MGSNFSCFEKKATTNDSTEDPSEAGPEKPPLPSSTPPIQDESFDGFAKQFGFIGRSQRHMDNDSLNSEVTTRCGWKLLEGSQWMVVHGWFS